MLAVPRLAAADNGTLPAVSFIKPVGEENEHSGYASTDNGESHLVDLLKRIHDLSAAIAARQGQRCRERPRLTLYEGARSARTSQVVGVPKAVSAFWREPDASRRSRAFTRLCSRTGR